MKYCIPFFVGMNSIKKVDEITIKYKENRYDTLIDFLKERFYVRVIINMLDRTLSEEDVKFFAALAEKEEYSFALLFSYRANKDLIPQLKETKIQYFFQEYCTEWGALAAFIEAGVSDVYIVNDLGFDLQRVSDFVHGAGVKVRVFPNVAQEMYSTQDPITRFFIRPEDIPLYEKYVDVCEIFGEAGITENIYFVYAAQKWNNSINNLISNIEEDFTNTFLLENFSVPRLTCQRKCKRGNGCDFCMKKVRIAKGIDRIRRGAAKNLS
jgi:hypothetical protein